MDNKLIFKNWTDEPFIGRFGGVDMTFEPGQEESYDSDKHYMLLLLAKQLADRELLKKVKAIGRNPQNMETWGKSLDEQGQVFVISAEHRKEYMRKAIGGLTDIPVKLPEPVLDNEEAGATQKVSADVEALQKEVQELKELIAQNVTNHTNGVIPSPTQKVEVPATPEAKEELTGSLLRESLVELATELNIPVTNETPKDVIIEAIAKAKNEKVQGL